jgi:hypothetical protein
MVLGTAYGILFLINASIGRRNSSPSRLNWQSCIAAFFFGAGDDEFPSSSSSFVKA